MLIADAGQQRNKRHQPLRAQAFLESRKRRGAYMDGVQGFLRLPFRLEEVGSSSYTLSAHKIRGPKGIGALVTSGGARLSPRVYGGGQEGGLRSGTENTPGITGMMKAVETYPASHRMRDMTAAGPARAPYLPWRRRPDSSTVRHHHISACPFRWVGPRMNMLERAGAYVGIGCLRL